MPPNPTRRELVLAAACWAQIVRAQGPRRLIYFDKATADEIAALAAQIIPDDETPGAMSAGVIWFIDRSLADYDRDKREAYVSGLAATQARRAKLFPGSTSIAGLSAEQRIVLLKEIEKTDFFDVLRFHTILGFFGNPAHGGNRDEVGWKLIGIENRMHYEPPFGFYDAETHGGEIQ